MRRVSAKVRVGCLLTQKMSAGSKGFAKVEGLPNWSWTPGSKGVRSCSSRLSASLEGVC